MASVAQSERHALCDLLLEVGPEAPTLCEGWDSGDLAAHLIVRERRPLAGIGIVMSSLSGVTDKAMAKVRAQPWEEVVARIRSGPPIPMRWVDSQVNTIEFFVHHEDVRRGDRTTGPRTGIDDVHAALWDVLPRAARMMTRGARHLGIEVARPGGAKATVREGDATVRLVGEPGELILYLYGRKEVAQVELEGDEAAVAALTEAQLGV